ncbi:MAG: hypothetical protein KTR33_03140 [Gammaproteobacteria bacterium]|nr:hypothetical protein [Gammaproteobacteria bacterium]
MNGDEPRGMRRRDILKVRRKEIQLLSADESGGRRWLMGAAGAFGLFLVVVLTYSLYRAQ